MVRSLGLPILSATLAVTPSESPTPGETLLITDNAYTGTHLESKSRVVRRAELVDGQPPPLVVWHDHPLFDQISIRRASRRAGLAWAPSLPGHKGDGHNIKRAQRAAEVKRHVRMLKFRTVSKTYLAPSL
jgi:hypothetical protein